MTRVGKFLKVKSVCECGCNEIIDAYYRGWPDKPRRFKHGHNNNLRIRKDTQYKKRCECGCGELINAYTLGQISKPLRFKTGHQFRLKNYKGSNHPLWKGGRRHDSRGYIVKYAPGNIHADMNGFAKEHILVYEEFYKCSILEGIDVHHINGKKDDNRVDNLQLVRHTTHSNNHRDSITGRFMATSLNT